MNIARAAVGVKRMGELDNKPFQVAAKRKYGKQQAGMKAAKLCSLWQDHIQEPSWHPFKIITHEGNQMVRDCEHTLDSCRQSIAMLWSYLLHMLDIIWSFAKISYCGMVVTCRIKLNFHMRSSTFSKVTKPLRLNSLSFF